MYHVDPMTSDSTVFNFQLVSKLENQFGYLECTTQVARFASAMQAEVNCFCLN